MLQTYTRLQKCKQLLIILIPILITQVAMFGMTFFDTIMSGNFSSADLAGVAIGSSIWVPVQTGLTGILLAVTPIVAQLVGASNREQVPQRVLQGMYFALALAAVVILAGILLLDPVLAAMQLEPKVQETAKQYLTAMAYGIPALFLYTVLRCFIEALGFTAITMFITLISLPVNAALNYIFIFGKMGVPPMGGPGSGVASALTYWWILLITVWVVTRLPRLKEYEIFGRLYGVSLRSWKELSQIGLPIGFAIFFETSIFAAVTILMSRYNTLTIAAHQAAINFASLLYMLPLSVSMALTILVAYEVGAKRPQDAKQYGYIGIGLAVGIALLSATILLVFPNTIAGLYSKEPDVIALTRHFLIYALFFQLFDAVAAPIQGALRGYKDVRVTLVVALISYWGIGLPSGYLLAEYTTMNAFGYWIGLSAGLAAGAVGLFSRLIYIQRRFRKDALYEQALNPS